MQLPLNRAVIAKLRKIATQHDTKQSNIPQKVVLEKSNRKKEAQKLKVS